MFVGSGFIHGGRFQCVQSFNEQGHSRGGIQPCQRHGPVAHPSGYGETSADGPFLRRAEHAILGLTDNGSGHGIGMAAIDKILNAEHLIFLIAQDPADDRPGQGNTGPFQSGHGDEHGSQISLGVVGPASIHAPIHNFGPERIAGPNGNVTGGHDIRVAFEHQHPLTRPGRVGDDHIGSAGGHLVHLGLKSLVSGPAHDIFGHRLLAGAGHRIPDRVDPHQIGGQFDQFIAVNGILYLVDQFLRYHVKGLRIYWSI